jgi:hypothetical protein
MLTRVLFAAFLLVGAAGSVSAQDTTVVALGLTDHVVTEDELVSGADLAKPRFNSPGVAYVLVAHAQKGDKIEIHLTKDGESLMHNVRELDADEAGVLVLAGKTGVPAGGWPEGNYTAKVKITRGGEMLAEQETDPIPFE